MSFLLVAALLGGIGNTTPAVTAAAPDPSYVAGAGDTWDLENDTCQHRLEYRGNVLQAVDEIDYHVVNHESDTPVTRIEILNGRRGGTGGDCHDSATAPVGWTAQVLLDGTVVFVAQSPADVIERGGQLYGFKVGRHSGGDCCHTHRGYGPGYLNIRDDDDNREDCSCNLVPVAPTSWSRAKILYR